MIQSVLIFNQQGKPRLVKNFNKTLNNSQLVNQSFKLVQDRTQACNFVSLGDYTLVYRNYATLFFCLVIDSNESNLGILDLIQVMVEALDRLFESVCELDLVFHFDQVHFIVDEIIQGGLVIETNVNQIVNNGMIHCTKLFHFLTRHSQRANSETQEKSRSSSDTQLWLV